MNTTDYPVILMSDQHELGFVDPNDQEISWTRRAARAVLVDTAGKIAVMYFTSTGSYKLPGGGIDEGEDIEAALHREVREETGFKITDIKPIGIVDENRYFCGMRQLSYCFLARATDFVGNELTPEESALGMELRWVDTIEDAIIAIESSDTVDDNGSVVGLRMMQLREKAILSAAQAMINA